MTDASKKPDASAALRLLKGIAGELRDLAEDTARFGEMLSGDRKIVGANESIGLLQRFDLFVQNMQAHALLIDRLSTRLEANSTDVATLHDLIGHIPFFNMRERMRAILDGVQDRDEVSKDEAADEHWF